MKRLIVGFVAIAALTASAVAGEVYARQILSQGTATNASWTIGKYDRPTVLKIDVTGMLPAYCTGTVSIAYGDAAAGTRGLGAIVCSGGAGSLTVTNNAYMIADDILKVGCGAGGTQAVWRVHYLQRDTRPIN